MPGQELAPKGSLFFAAKHAECARSPGEAKRDAPRTPMCRPVGMLFPRTGKIERWDFGIPFLRMNGLGDKSLAT